jgi:aminoglycoside phosphotransferase family enzyme/predicted kinase
MGEWVRDLLVPGVELRQTHISWVFLRADDAFKVKKPVGLGFLDFTTKEKRREACEAEVRLNRRLAPDVYRGVVPVTLDALGRHRFGGEGEPVDWAVSMRRLPDSHRADVRLERGELTGEDVERVAGRVARFHGECGPSEAAKPFGTVEAIRFNVLENFEQTSSTIHRYLDPERVKELEAWQVRFLEERRPLFEARLGTGRIRDGHGDLRLEHVYLDERGEVTILDCIEFNDRFRYADVCTDVVFLAMDLAWHGRVDLAERFLARYAREAGDYDLYPLVDFYQSYRAFVRGKIASMTAGGAGASFEVRERAAAEARRYFLLALASERQGLVSPRVVAVGGFIASGKSTIADALGREMPAPVVDADRTRKHLAGVAPEQPLPEGPWKGFYSPEFTRKVYSELRRRASAVLASGRPVVLDASFRARAHRAEAKRLARETGVPFLFLECRAPEGLCRERLREREKTSTVSDGRTEIFGDFGRSWEPVDELDATEHVVLDTSLPVAGNLATLAGTIPFAPPRFTA